MKIASHGANFFCHLEDLPYLLDSRNLQSAVTSVTYIAIISCYPSSQVFFSLLPKRDLRKKDFLKKYINWQLE